MSKLNDVNTIGLILYGHGGMNTDYDFDTFYAGRPSGVDLSQLFVGVPWAIKDIGSRVETGVQRTGFCIQPVGQLSFVSGRHFAVAEHSENLEPPIHILAVEQIRVQRIDANDTWAHLMHPI